MTLNQALNRLAELSEDIAISQGRHIYRDDMPPHYKWEVVAWPYKGMCYPPFSQKDKLLDAVKEVIADIQRRYGGKSRK